MAKPPMTSQFAKRLWETPSRRWERRVDFWVKVLRTHHDEVVKLAAAGKDLRNILRVLNARHGFMKRSERRADMRLIRRHRSELDSLLRCRFDLS